MSTGLSGPEAPQITPGKVGYSPHLPTGHRPAFDQGSGSDAPRTGIPYQGHSVNDQSQPSADGYSATDAQRIIPGGRLLPSANDGTSAATYAARMAQMTLPLTGIVPAGNE